MFYLTSCPAPILNDMPKKNVLWRTAGACRIAACWFQDWHRTKLETKLYNIHTIWWTYSREHGRATRGKRLCRQQFWLKNVYVWYHNNWLVFWRAVDVSGFVVFTIICFVSTVTKDVWLKILMTSYQVFWRDFQNGATIFMSLVQIQQPFGESYLSRWQI